MIFIQRVVHLNFKFSNFVEYRFSEYDLMILWISSMSVIMCLLSFLIFLIWIFTPFLLVVWIEACLFCWFSWITNSLSHCFLCFYFVDFCSQFDYFCNLAFLGEFASFCSRVFKCSLNSLVWQFSSLFMNAFNAMNFSLNTAFMVFHNFEYVLWLFSLNFKKSLISSHFFLDPLMLHVFIV